MLQSNTADTFQQPDELRQVYLAGLRKRFKAEINRMTRGDMLTLLHGQQDADISAFLMSYVYIWHWLQRNVDDAYQAEVLSAFSKGRHGFLMPLLQQADSARDLVRAYVEYWSAYSGDAEQQQHNCQLLLERHGNAEQLAEYIDQVWQRLGLFKQSHTLAYRDLAQQEKERYRGMLGPEDRERLSLVDALPDTKPLSRSYAKLALIPHMGCPQTCRHCMFIFRPLLKDKRDPSELYQQVDSMTESVLFTGGDLTNYLDHFYNAIASMRNVRTFAILLNGDFADSRDAAEEVIGKMARAVRQRPVHWPKAKVILQVSFDEFHQEVYLDKKGQLKERIPVAKIASIVETAPKYSDALMLCLVHKQHSLNFSMDLFKKGVFSRLANELGKRGHQVQVISAAPSARLKRNPQNPAQPAQVIKDANFILRRYPNAPVLLTSSTMDGYGRAAEMDVSETVNEKDLLKEVLGRGAPEGEYFDIDLMFWFNGWTTLFSAVHMCLGNVFDEGMDTIIRRHQKDPLSAALYGFDRRLLDYYAEVRSDLDEKIEAATGPHHLFHTLTEDAEVRLHMTKRLIEESLHCQTETPTGTS